MATNYIMNFTDPDKDTFSIAPYSTDGIEFPAASTAGVISNTSLMLYGKGQPNYGERFQENLVFMLEHFAGQTPPNNPIQGQVWYSVVDHYRRHQVPPLSDVPTLSWWKWDLDTQLWVELAAGIFTPGTVDPPTTPTTLGYYYVYAPAGQAPEKLYQWTRFDSSTETYRRINYFEGSAADPNTMGFLPIHELLVYNGEDWVPVNSPSALVDGVEPSQVPARVGDLWFNTAEGLLYTYTSLGWLSTTPDLTAYLLKSGGSMTGALYVHQDPLTDLQVATKRYVDQEVAVVAGATITTTNVDNVSNVNSGTGTLTAALNNLDTRVLANAGSITAALLKSGGTMTGDLFLVAHPVPGDSAFQAATKGYVDQEVATAVAYTDSTENYVVGVSFNAHQMGTNRLSITQVQNLDFLTTAIVLDAQDIRWVGPDGIDNAPLTRQLAAPAQTTRERIGQIEGVFKTRTTPGRTIFQNITSWIVYNNTTTYFDIVGDYTNLFLPDYQFEVSGSASSPSNDGVYTVSTAVATGSPLVTRITTVESIPNGGSGGTIDLLTYRAPRYPIGEYKSWVFVDGVKKFVGDTAYSTIEFESTLGETNLARSPAYVFYKWGTQNITPTTAITLGDGTYSFTIEVDGYEQTIEVDIGVGTFQPATFDELLNDATYGLNARIAEVFPITGDGVAEEDVPVTGSATIDIVTGNVSQGYMRFKTTNRGVYRTFNADTITSGVPNNFSIHGDDIRTIFPVGRKVIISGTPLSDGEYSVDSTSAAVSISFLTNLKTYDTYVKLVEPIAASASSGQIRLITTLAVTDVDLFSSITVSGSTGSQAAAVEAIDDTDPNHPNQVTWTFSCTTDGGSSSYNMYGADCLTYEDLANAITATTSGLAVANVVGNTIVVRSSTFGSASSISITDLITTDLQYQRAFFFAGTLVDIDNNGEAGFDGEYVESRSGSPTIGTHNNWIQFVTAPSTGSDIEIISYGQNGIA